MNMIPSNEPRNLTLAGIVIRRDSEGRYCLNDLHKAAGSEQRHQPRYWAASDTTKELAAQISNSDIPLFTQRGRYGGTYAVKELVYAYAMWISPQFHLAVIRAYDALVTGAAQPAPRAPAELTRMEILRLAMESEEQRLAAEQARLAAEHKSAVLESELAKQAPKVAFHDAVAADTRALTIREVAKVHGMSDRTMYNSHLINSRCRLM